MKSIIGINTHTLTPNKNPILTIIRINTHVSTIKENHRNIYIYINNK